MPFSRALDLGLAQRAEKGFGSKSVELKIEQTRAAGSTAAIEETFTRLPPVGRSMIPITGQ